MTGKAAMAGLRACSVAGLPFRFESCQNVNEVAAFRRYVYCGVVKATVCRIADS
jgi:hypothetical protein